MAQTENKGWPGRDELVALLKLKLAPGVPDRAITMLMRRHGSADAALRVVLQQRPEAAVHLAKPEVLSRLHHAVRWIRDQEDLSIFVFGAGGYPERLYHLHDPPPILFARGDLSLLELPSVAVVGTRTNTVYGGDVTRMLATCLAKGGIVVISGLAHGIDRIAHEATLDAGGLTVAVVGTGIDVAYPSQHDRLQERIAIEGLLLSEFLPGDPALPYHFPQRNRIIAALAVVVVVVEAPVPSGALLTANHALDLGRELYVVPGPIGRRTSDGTNALLIDGAMVMTDPRDVITSALSLADTRSSRQPSAPERAPPAAGVHEGLWAALTDEPLHVDLLGEQAGLSPADALHALLELELGGLARQFPGLRFSRMAA